MMLCYLDGFAAKWPDTKKYVSYHGLEAIMEIFHKNETLFLQIKVVFYSWE